MRAGFIPFKVNPWSDQQTATFHHLTNQTEFPMKARNLNYAASALLLIAAATANAGEASHVELGTRAGLSTVINKGIDGKGLTMEEKWSHDVVVCKRTQMTGSRFFFKVCHTRGEWQAMRSNAWESTDYSQRIGF
ncbi:MAG: hypothetical protein KDI71_07115 [Xanthomonadales bacterium]|nr:hypothetical protein [Xanthomonadales bacterium]